MNSRLQSYLELDRAALRLEAIDEEAADAVRDVMDEIWYQLSTADRELLNERTIVGPESIRLPAAGVLFEPPPQLTKRLIGTIPLANWRSAA